MVIELLLSLQLAQATTPKPAPQPQPATPPKAAPAQPRTTTARQPASTAVAGMAITATDGKLSFPMKNGYGQVLGFLTLTPQGNGTLLELRKTGALMIGGNGWKKCA